MNKYWKYISFFLIVVFFTTACEPSNKKSTNKKDSFELSSDIVWAGSVTTELDMSKYSKYKIEILKNEDERSLIDHLLQGITTGQVNAYDYNHKKLSQEEIEEIVSSVDTSVTLDPETGEEKVKIKENNIRDNIHIIKLKQELYYDSKLKKVSSRLMEIGLVSKEYDNMGNHIGNLHRFWIKMKE